MALKGFNKSHWRRLSRCLLLPVIVGGRADEGQSPADLCLPGAPQQMLCPSSSNAVPVGLGAAGLERCRPARWQLRRDAMWRWSTVFSWGDASEDGAEIHREGADQV